MTRYAHTLRDGAFLTNERLWLIPAALLLAFVAALSYLAISAHGINDYKGRPLGTDFSNIYAAGQFANQGDAATPFDPLKQWREERKIFGPNTPFYGWHYPPFFLLIASPLAHLPYIPALVVWQITTLGLYLFAMRLLLRKGPAPELAKQRLWILLTLAFPAVFVNLTHGHNGFLTAALMTGAIAVLDERPLIAGILFGLLVYKPQFGLMIPLVLATTGRWKTFASATATVAALCLIVTAIFGTDIWTAFLGSTHFTRVEVLENGGTGFYKIQSVFAWARLWAAPVWLAYALQACVTIVVGVLLVRLWRSDASMARKGAALCIAAILSTPYSLDYDMMVLAPAIALLTANGIAHGFRAYEKSALAFLWAVPILTRSIAYATAIPLGVPAMLIAFGFAVQG